MVESVDQLAWRGWAAAVAMAAVAAMAGWLGCEQGSAVRGGPVVPTQTERATTGKTAAEDATKNGSATTPPKPKPGAKTVVLEKAGDRPFDKTFDDLRFDMIVGEKFERSMLTKEIEALDGQRIRIRGYILPTPQKHGIRQFVLVRDNQECCFGPGAALYDCILVEMKQGKTANFTIRPIAVDGKFEVHEFVVGGKHLAIYRMEAESAG
ncbi:MAG: DUF3299 domain-containing protein [Pirellulales bacterium]|nr:DUF3299 domain-containing protein [Pirellulales bacterium]